MDNGRERWSKMQDIAYPFLVRAGMAMKTDGIGAAYAEPGRSKLEDGKLDERHNEREHSRGGMMGKMQEDAQWNLAF
jgi:hypothetical protein